MNKLLDFYFICFEPFLTPIDWLSLSHCNHQTHQKCQLKKTMFPKFKKEFKKILFHKKIHFSDLLFQELVRTHSIISGSSVLSALLGAEFSQDIDIFGIDACNLNLPDTTHLRNQTFLNYTRYHNINEINNVTDIMMDQNVKCLQYIEYQIPDEKNVDSRVNSALSILPAPPPLIIDHDLADHKEKIIKKLIHRSFDFDFCKNFFNGTSLEIGDLESLWKKESSYNYPFGRGRNFLNWFYDFNFEHCEQRIRKYQDRQFHVMGTENIPILMRIQQALILYRDLHLSKLDKYYKYRHYELKFKNLNLQIQSLEKKIPSPSSPVDEKIQICKDNLTKIMDEFRGPPSTALNHDFDRDLQEWSNFRAYDTQKIDKSYYNLLSDSIVNKWVNSKNSHSYSRNAAADDDNDDGGADGDDYDNYTNHKRYPFFKDYKIIKSSRYPLLKIKSLCPKAIYTILCYANKSFWLCQFFNPNHVPFEWIKYLIPYYRGLIEVHQPSQLTSTKFTRLLWKNIYYKWPHHHQIYCS